MDFNFSKENMQIMMYLFFGSALLALLALTSEFNSIAYFLGPLFMLLGLVLAKRE